MEEATTRALETVREIDRVWQRAHLAELQVILARDASAPVTLAVARASTAKAAPQREAFIPGGMSATMARDEAVLGRLPTRAIRRPEQDEHVRLMDRVKLLQATHADCRDYHAAYVEARKLIAAEDEYHDDLVTERVAVLQRLGGGFTDHTVALATAKAQIAAEDQAAAKGGAK